jgi:hypothetical protein
LRASPLGPGASSWFSKLKFWRLPVALAVAAAVAGCAPMRTGATLDAIAPLKPGLARVFVLRDRAFGDIFDTGCRPIWTRPHGDLKTGMFFVYFDFSPHRLYCTARDLFRASAGDFRAPRAHLLLSPRHE